MSGQSQGLTREKADDILRYASAVVMIATDPDNPTRTRVDVIQVPHRRPICLLEQAEALREVADELVAAHNAGRC